MKRSTRNLIDDDSIWDQDGLLKDGKTYRRSMYLMDHDLPPDHAETRPTRRVIVDGAARKFGLNQPGYRVVSDEVPLVSRVVADAQRQAVADARAAYLHDLQNAWRNPRNDAAANFGGNNDPSLVGFGSHGPRGSVGANPPAGSYPFHPELVGGACTVDGQRGRLVEQDGWLVCRPIKDAEDDDDDIVRRTSDAKHRREPPVFGEDDEDEIARNASTHTESSLRRHHRASLAELTRDHQQKMDALYQALDREIENAWRKG